MSDVRHILAAETSSYAHIKVPVFCSLTSGGTSEVPVHILVLGWSPQTWTGNVIRVRMRNKQK